MCWTTTRPATSYLILLCRFAQGSTHAQKPWLAVCFFDGMQRPCGVTMAIRKAGAGEGLMICSGGAGKDIGEGGIQRGGVDDSELPAAGQDRGDAAGAPAQAQERRRHR